MEITKEQFLTAYYNHPPSGWVKFAFKYFSKSTKPEDMWLSRSLTGLMVVMFLGGFMGTVLELGRPFIGLTTLVLGVALVFVAIVMSVGRTWNNLRIRKIRKELGGVSKYEYNKLADKYLLL